ncbi:uncharacterized protein [Henckelia pumila]|uniref:uncharacterized protein n=1 Tax=Henckelia pumila TaxID=405737 RepID=UPI003C6E727E
MQTKDGIRFNQEVEEIEKILNSSPELPQSGIVLGHIVSSKGIEVDKAKIDIIQSLPYPVSVREKDVSFEFNEPCKTAFDKLKDSLTSAPIIQPPDWTKPFEIMCDASDYAVGAVEAKTTHTDDSKVVAEFIQHNIFSRFGIPRALISDRGTHFCNRTVASLLKKYHVMHKLSTAYHPQSNGQAENRFQDTDWDVPISIDFWETMPSACRIGAYASSKIYKENTKAFHDKMISRRMFEVGQKVLLYHSRLRLFPGKLRSIWIGPFVITDVFPHGALEIKSLETAKTFKANGQRLKHYFEGIQANAEEVAHDLTLDDPP